MLNHYLPTGFFKALAATLAPTGGGEPKPLTGPRGGKIKKISPTTGKPIYYKPWSAGQGYNTPPVATEDKGGYEIYKKGSVIGKTGQGQPIHSDVEVNDKYNDRTQNYHWRDHIDAHQAHFSLAQYIKNLIMKRIMEGGDTSKLHGRYNAHMNFSKHHYKEALLNLIHGEGEAPSQKDLSQQEMRPVNEA